MTNAKPHPDRSRAHARERPCTKPFSSGVIYTHHFLIHSGDPAHIMMPIGPASTSLEAGGVSEWPSWPFPSIAQIVIQGKRLQHG